MNMMIKDGLWGFIVGDAMGAAVEFGERWMRDLNPVKEMRSGGMFEVSIGGWTDDTSMVLATLHSLQFGYDLKDMMDRFVKWLRKGEYSFFDYPIGIGKQVLRAIEEYEITGDIHEYYDWYKTQYPQYKDEQINVSWIMHIPQICVRRAPGITCLDALSKKDFNWDKSINNSKGCGGVMRIAPIPLFTAGKGGVTAKDNAKWCAQAAAITHGHPLGWISAAAFGHLLYDIMQNFSLYWSVIDTIAFIEEEYKEYEETKVMVQLLNEAIGIANMSGYSSTPNIMLEFDGNQKLGEGWVGEEALAIAVCCSLDGKGFAQNLQSAVGHNGDSDSTGSIAGQIMGAYYGEKAIPKEWLDNLELREVIEEIADDMIRAVYMCKDYEYEEDTWTDKYLFAHK